MCSWARLTFIMSSEARLTLVMSSGVGLTLIMSSEARLTLIMSSGVGLNFIIGFRGQTYFNNGLRGQSHFNYDFMSLTFLSGFSMSSQCCRYFPKLYPINGLIAIGSCMIFFPVQKTKIKYQYMTNQWFDVTVTSNENMT